MSDDARPPPLSATFFGVLALDDEGFFDPEQAQHCCQKCSTPIRWSNGPNIFCARCCAAGDWSWSGHDFTLFLGDGWTRCWRCGTKGGPHAD